jgi:hypothetical protein
VIPLDLSALTESRDLKESAMQSVVAGLVLTAVAVTALRYARELIMIAMAVMLALMFIGLVTVFEALQLALHQTIT